MPVRNSEELNARMTAAMQTEIARVEDQINSPTISDTARMAILRVHLITEQQLRKTLKARNPNLAVDKIRQYDLLRRLVFADFADSPLNRSFEALNRLRNVIAHQVDAVVDDALVRPMRTFIGGLADGILENDLQWFADITVKIMAAQRESEQIGWEWDQHAALLQAKQDVLTEVLEAAGETIEEEDS